VALLFGARADFDGEVMKQGKPFWAGRGSAEQLSWAKYRSENAQPGEDSRGGYPTMRDETRAEVVKQARKAGKGEDLSAELTALISENFLLHGRLTNVFSTIKDSVGLTGMEALTLFAIVNSDKPVTIPQVGRSLGHARQVIQRAANALEQRGLVQTMDNPGHKRAAFVVSTEAGAQVKRMFDAAGREIAQTLSDGMDLATIRATHQGLRRLRKNAEARDRELQGLPGGKKKVQL
jgi:DNA-binding MarR family transcriptional regulator